MGKGASAVLIPRVSLVLALCFLTQASPSSTQLKRLLIAHPDDTSKQVEYFIRTPVGEGPWPTLIFLHGHQEDPRTGGSVFVQWGVLDQIAERGYLALAVSQPGYGKSTGPADFCGPFTQRAVMAVIAKARQEGYVSQKKLVIVGTSRGALVAGLIAAKDGSVSGVVLISGLFDLLALGEGASGSETKQAILNSVLAETGGGDDALRVRSVMSFASDIKATTLILNGGNDDRTDPDQARRLAEEINRHGGDARSDHLSGSRARDSRRDSKPRRRSIHREDPWEVGRCGPSVTALRVSLWPIRWTDSRLPRMPPRLPRGKR